MDRTWWCFLVIQVYVEVIYFLTHFQITFTTLTIQQSVLLYFLVQNILSRCWTVAYCRLILFYSFV